jgi:hypothetical protein
MAPEAKIADMDAFAFLGNCKGDLAYGFVCSVHHLGRTNISLFRIVPA